MHKTAKRITGRALLATAGLLGLAGLVSLLGCGGEDGPVGAHGQLASIEIALLAYNRVFGALPPSEAVRVAQCGHNGNRVGEGHAVTGAEALCFFLHGWYMDGPNVVRGVKYKRKDLSGALTDLPPMYVPDENEEFAATDARYGFGGAPRGCFLGDRWRNHRPILYFRASREDGGRFDESDNAAILNRWKAPNARPFESFVMVRGVPRANRFLLWSAGRDGLYFSDDDIITGR